jgi:hypothetical protein
LLLIVTNIVARLGSAIDARFAARGSTAPVRTPLGLSDAFSLDAEKVRQWQAFLRRRQPRTATPPLPDTIEAIRQFVLPVVERLHAAH